MNDFQPDFKNKILSSIRVIKDFPKKGILFRDITTLLNNATLFYQLISELKMRYKPQNLDFIVGIESRGFILGTALAYALEIGFVPIRKKGKLPYKTFQASYSLEYGQDCIEIHQDAFLNKPNARVLLVDDLIATGGTARAACELIKKAGGECVEAMFLLCLSELYQEKLNVKTFSILEI